MTLWNLKLPHKYPSFFFPPEFGLIETGQENESKILFISDKTDSGECGFYLLVRGFSHFEGRVRQSSH